MGLVVSAAMDRERERDPESEDENERGVLTGIIIGGKQIVSNLKNAEQCSWRW